ncbi:MAG: VOC family protein [Armatimonadota bacterium]
MRVLHATPALPTSDMNRSVGFYRDKLGFSVVHHESDFAIVERDGVQIHLWAAIDESWRTSSKKDGVCPVVSGAESFIAGTASCRVAVTDVEELYTEVKARRALRPDAVTTVQPWGDKEFDVFDPDNNIVTFFQRGD